MHKIVFPFYCRGQHETRRDAEKAFDRLVEDGEEADLWVLERQSRNIQVKGEDGQMIKRMSVIIFNEDM